jgi:hypothetical protein
MNFWTSTSLVGLEHLQGLLHKQPHEAAAAVLHCSQCTVCEHVANENHLTICSKMTSSGRFSLSLCLCVACSSWQGLCC